MSASPSKVGASRATWSQLTEQMYEVDKTKFQRKLANEVLLPMDWPYKMRETVASYCEPRITPDTPLGELLGKDWVDLTQEVAGLQLANLNIKCYRDARFICEVLKQMPKEVFPSQMRERPELGPLLEVEMLQGSVHEIYDLLRSRGSTAIQHAGIEMTLRLKRVGNDDYVNQVVRVVGNWLTFRDLEACLEYPEDHQEARAVARAKFERLATTCLTRLFSEGKQRPDGAEKERTPDAVEASPPSLRALAQHMYETEKAKNLEQFYAILLGFGITRGPGTIVASYYLDPENLDPKIAFTPDTPLSKICGKGWINLKTEDELAAAGERLQQSARFIPLTIGAIPHRWFTLLSNQNPNTPYTVPVIYVLQSLAEKGCDRLIESEGRDPEVAGMYRNHASYFGAGVGEAVLAAFTDRFTFNDLASGILDPHAEEGTMRQQALDALEKKLARLLTGHGLQHAEGVSDLLIVPWQHEESDESDEEFEESVNDPEAARDGGSALNLRLSSSSEPEAPASERKD